ELEVGDKAYAMPWDSGPVAVFYRRDFYEKAGVDPASIKTWDDFIAAGKKIQAANPGVIMTNADFNGDTEFFRMISNEQGCAYFAEDGQSITVNQPKCVDAMTKVKEMKDAGIVS
ncbi:MAG: extracellular solute-binding protein, partial [Mesorhizobium sp.]